MCLTEQDRPSHCKSTSISSINGYLLHTLITMSTTIEDTPTHPSTAERLSAELYPNIISNLPRSALPKTMRVNSNFYTIAAKLLYTSLDVNLSHGIAPFEAAFPPSPANSHNVSQLPSSPLSRNPSTATGSSVLASLPSRFSYTTHLTLTTHTSKTCRTIQPLSMPNLVSLRIRPIHDNDHLIVCHCIRKPGVKSCPKPLTATVLLSPISGQGSSSLGTCRPVLLVQHLLHPLPQSQCRTSSSISSLSFGQ